MNKESTQNNKISLKNFLVKFTAISEKFIEEHAKKNIVGCAEIDLISDDENNVKK